MCLEKNPARRYESAAVLAKDLEDNLVGLPTKSHPPVPVRQVSFWMRRHPTRTVFALLVALFMAAGVAAAFLCRVGIAACSPICS
jgi:hypothetical protein